MGLARKILDSSYGSENINIIGLIGDLMIKLTVIKHHNYVTFIGELIFKNYESIDIK